MKRNKNSICNHDPFTGLQIYLDFNMYFMAHNVCLVGVDTKTLKGNAGHMHGLRKRKSIH